MGKVYEALNKSGRERSKQEWFPMNDEPAEDGRSRDFDFVQYSLNALGERAQPGGHSVAARKAAVQPAGEMILDSTRIDPRLVALTESDPRISEQYIQLAVSVVSAAAERPFKRLLIASAQRGEGRTCVALNLACALARARQRVIVVETDLHRPSVSRLLGIDLKVGLAEAVSRKLSADAASVTLRPCGLDVLPLRERVENSAELLTAGSFRALLKGLDATYDFVLFDSPPLLGGADAAFLVKATEATLLVLRAGKNNFNQLGKAIAPLVRDNVVGVVLNRVGQA